MLLSSPFCGKYRYFEFFLLPFSWSLDSTNLSQKLTHVEELSIGLSVWVVTSEWWLFWKFKQAVPPQIVRSEIVLQNVVLPQHVLDSFFPLFNLDVFLLVQRFATLFIYEKTVWQFAFYEALFFWLGLWFWFFEASMLRVAHVPIRWCLWARLHKNCFGFFLLVLFDVGCLDGQVSAFLTFPFVLFAPCINLLYQVSVNSKIFLPIFLILILVLANRHSKHFVLNIWFESKITSAF